MHVYVLYSRTGHACSPGSLHSPPNPTTRLPGGVASMKAGATGGGEVNLGAESQVYRPVSVLSQSAGQR